MSERQFNLLLAYLVLASLLAVGIAGCATPKAHIVTKELRVPIAVACSPPPIPEPAYAADAVLLDGTIFDLVQALLIDREQRKIAELNLRATLDGCR